MSHLCVLPAIRSSDPPHEVYRTVTRTESTRRDSLGSTTPLIKSVAPDNHIRTSTGTALTAHSEGTCSFTRREMAHVMQEPFGREHASQARNMERVPSHTRVAISLTAPHARGEFQSNAVSDKYPTRIAFTGASFFAPDGRKTGTLGDINILPKSGGPDHLMRGMLGVFEFIVVAVEVEHADVHRSTLSEHNSDVEARRNLLATVVYEAGDYPAATWQYQPDNLVQEGKPSDFGSFTLRIEVAAKCVQSCLLASFVL